MGTAEPNDRFNWDGEGIIFSFPDRNEAMPKLTDEERGVTKDQYAEIAERDGHFAGEHATAMASGSIQKSAIVLHCTPEAVEQLKPLLEKLKRLGELGASREIRIEPIDNSDRDTVFYFDGDGNAKIESLDIDGVRKAMDGAAQVADRAGYGDIPLIQPVSGYNPYSEGRADKEDLQEAEGRVQEREGKMKGELIEKSTPEKGESQEAFMDRCIHNLIDEGRSPQKGADMCYAIWHRTKGTTRKSQDELAVKKASLMRLVTKGAVRLARTFVQKAN